jgi:hypothetical protein
MSHRGATLLLDRGRISISTDSVSFPPELDYGENEHFLKVFILTYVRFLSDSPLRRRAGDKPVRTYIRFLKHLTGSHLRGIIKDYSLKSDRMLKESYSIGRDASIRVFDESMKDTPVFKEYLEWFNTGDIEIGKYLLSFLRFGKKLNYIDPDLDATAFRGWQDVEDRLRTLTFVDDDVASLHNIVGELLPRLDTTLLFPRFGTGKVAERDIKDVYDKLAKLKIHPRLAYAFLRKTSFRMSEGFANVLGDDLECDSDSDTSLAKYVPKDMFKSRSIGMEPNDFMYFQQEVMRWMVRGMEDGPMRKFVNLRDQTVNQRGAMMGSKYHHLDTIDLSSASDSVHVELVKRVFPRDWLFYMLATRSSKVSLPNGTVVGVTKFAPMGSAVCFPTQCILFTAICLYAYFQHTSGRTTGIVSPSEARDTIRSVDDRLLPRATLGKRLECPIVYGDDIICDSRVTDRVITLLSRFGFEVNVGKSFTSSQSFRESCGVYCYEGSDVTPVLFRIPFLRRGKWDAKVYASVIESINYWRSNGYHTIATLWLSILKDYGFKYRIPFVTNTDAFGLFTVSKHSPKPLAPGYNGDWRIQISSDPKEPSLQILQERVQGIGPRVPRRKRPPHLEEYRLDQWWRSRIDGGSTSPITRGLTIRPQETRLVPIWARCE